MSEWNPQDLLENEPKRFGTLVWNMLTPFERERLLKRIKKKQPDALKPSVKSDIESTTPPPIEKVPKKEPKPRKSLPKPPKSTPVPTSREVSPSNEADPIPFERSVWDMKTRYQVAFADMIEMRTTIMEFLLVNYGIEAVEKFFLQDNPQWFEKIKVGTMKKIFAKMLSKLLPMTVLNKLADIVIENSQYLVGLDHIQINPPTDDRKIIEVTKCPVLKRFKKTLKTLKFTNLEERYICTFACVPVIHQMASVGNCNVTGEYVDKGCNLHVTLKAKGLEAASQAESDRVAQVRNGPSK